ncbi:MAG: tRNA threonylcarbamoyladenosine biosynthesis protein TsaB [Lentimonas sp.]|jgi:tRNA threonylcarbamoyladenosine biosynthesis protein TsaB
MPPSTQPQLPALVIDGSGSSVFSGVLGDSRKWLAQSKLSGAPLEQLFPSIESVLKEAALTLPAIRSYIYCEGPGSVLGLRLCAMAIETWSRLHPESNHCFAYNTLQLSAALLMRDVQVPDRVLLVSDWKKGAWNAVYINEGQIGATCVAESAELEAWDGALYHLPQRKGWQSPPPQAQTVEWAPERLNEVIHTSTLLLHPTEGVELYSNGVNTFAKWTAQRHRATLQS